MLTYRELTAKHQREVNELPIMYAFSNKQFEDGMRNKLGLEPNETDKIYRLGSTGGFYKKTDAQLLKETFDRHSLELQEAMKNDDFVLEMFEYEMGNHEYQISYDKEDVVNACGLDLDDMDERLEQLWLKAKKHFLELCLKNNWF